MNRRAWVALVWVLGSGLMVGCMDLESGDMDAADTNGVLEHTIVFGHKRDVDTVRSKWVRAVSTTDYTDEQTREMATVWLSQAVGTIRSRMHAPTPPEDCSPRIGTGSAFLTSPDRLMTAHHVVYGLVLQNPPAPGCNFEVVFDATMEQSPPDPNNLLPPLAGLSGSFPAYVSGVTDEANPWDGFDEHLPARGSNISAEEDPLLANRLVQLGLHEWARNNRGLKRNQLREWMFKMDYRSMDSTDGTPDRLHDFEGQLDGKSPFVHRVAGQLYRGRDAAVLEACGPSNTDFWKGFDDKAHVNYMPSGYFPVDAPGVFFNEVRMIVGDSTEGPECKGIEDPSFPGGCMIFTEIGSPPSTLVFVDEAELKADREVAPPTAEDLLFVCDRPGLANHAETHAGVVIGLLGASTTPSEEEASRIGSLALVCAPWSSHPYTSNWRFVTYVGEILAHAGGTSPDTLVSKFSRSYGLLSRALGYMFERRCANSSCSQTQLRPASMQLCPPNYVLRGVDFIVHKEEFAGVSALDCVSKDKNLNILKTVVPLNPNAHELYSNMFDRPTLAGDPFSLEQHIGRANTLADDQIVTVTCPVGKALGGMRVVRNASRVIVSVEPSCTTMPAVRMDREVP